MLDADLGDSAIEWNGTRYKTILKTKDTGGAMSIVDSVSQPGSGPPRHVHHDADEVFVTLTGDAEFWLDGERLHCGPGQSVFVAKGKNHTFRIVSDVPSRHLIILTPGGFEDFFEEMAAGQFAIPADMARIMEVAARYQLEFTGPPLAEREGEEG